MTATAPLPCSRCHCEPDITVDCGYSLISEQWVRSATAICKCSMGYCMSETFVDEPYGEAEFRRKFIEQYNAKQSPLNYRHGW